MNAVSEAVIEAGGQPDEFRGDAVVAVFGQHTEARTACRQALAFLAADCAGSDPLERVCRETISVAVRFATGSEWTAVTPYAGEIGYGDQTTVTAFGDALSVAARLQDLTKELACEALVTDAVMRDRQIDVTDFPLHTAMLRGIQGPIPVRIIRSIGSVGVGSEGQ